MAKILKKTIRTGIAIDDGYTDYEYEHCDEWEPESYNILGRTYWKHDVRTCWFDKMGNLIKGVYEDADGTREIEMEHEYHPNGNLKSTIKRFSDRDEVEKLYYDENGWEIRNERYDGNGRLISALDTTNSVEGDYRYARTVLEHACDHTLYECKVINAQGTVIKHFHDEIGAPNEYYYAVLNQYGRVICEYRVNDQTTELLAEHEYEGESEDNWLSHAMKDMWIIKHLQQNDIFHQYSDGDFFTTIQYTDEVEYWE